MLTGDGWQVCMSDTCRAGENEEMPRPQCWGSYSKKVIGYLLLVTSVNRNEITSLVAAFKK
jgi:hypothetical protein